MADTDKPKKKSKEKKEGKEPKEKKAKREKSRERSKSASKSRSSKSKEERKEERASSRAPAAAPTEAGAPSTAASMDVARLFEKYGGSGKGYLSQEDFGRAIQELNATNARLPATVGPYAAGLGTSVYGSGSSSAAHVIAPRPPAFPTASPVNAASYMLGQGYYGASPESSDGMALMQAYQTRMAALSSVTASLLGKREAMLHQLSKVQARMAEVVASRTMVENETIADTEAILHKVRSAEAAKLAMLQADTDTLSSDISAVDKFYHALHSFQPGAVATAPAQTAPASPLTTLNAAQALDFMRAYPEMCAEADRLAAKSIKMEIEVRADDFEREVARRLEVMGRYHSLMELVGAKDRIILHMMKDREHISDERDITVSEVDKLRSENHALRLQLAEMKEEKDRSSKKVSALENSVRSLKKSKLPLEDMPHDTEQWIRLTEELTTELNDVTERLVRLQASTAGESFTSGHRGRSMHHQHHSDEHIPASWAPRPSPAQSYPSNVMQRVLQMSQPPSTQVHSSSALHGFMWQPAPPRVVGPTTGGGADAGLPITGSGSSSPAVSADSLLQKIPTSFPPMPPPQPASANTSEKSKQAEAADNKSAFAPVRVPLAPTQPASNVDVVSTTPAMHKSDDGSDKDREASGEVRPVT